MDTKEKVKYPRVKKSSTIFFLKTLLFLLVVALIVLIRRMDQMSFRPITEEEALEMAQEIKVTLPDQEVTLLNSKETQKLKVGKTVKVLGVYKKKLNKGNSPRVYWTNQLYLLELPDGSRAYGPLMETALGQLNVLPEGDTAVITAVKKAKKNPTVQTTGAESRYEYTYTLEGHEDEYALEDLHIYFPERVAYLAKGLREEDFAITSDTIGENKKDFQKVKKFFVYDIRPFTKRVGFYVFPRYQTWNEFYLRPWFRNLLIIFAYLLEIGLIAFLFIYHYDIYDYFTANRKFNRNLRKAKRGDADACYAVGEALEHGFSGWHGVRKSTKPSESLWWYLRAADLGSGKACAKVGDVYENGRFTEEIDYDKAKSYYKKGANLGNRNCKEGKQRLDDLLDFQSTFGQNYYFATKLNWSINQFNLGLYYFQGKHVQHNGKEAYKWFKKAADNGSCYGWYGLGICYTKGEGVPKNIKTAISMLEKAIELEKPEPLSDNYGLNFYCCLGECYEDIYDYKQAMYYYLLITNSNVDNQDNAMGTALHQIGYLYYYGKGVTKDKDKAIYYFKKAAQLGKKESIDALKTLGVSY